jgi:maltooligosyltrehalose trehalohydrolase
MHRHAVWAPDARRIDLICEPGTPAESSEPLVRSEAGWWRHDGDGAAHGTDYAFRLDGGGELTPDPRSAWQPAGVHAPSRIFDPDRFTWTDDSWPGPRQGAGTLGGVLYELHLGTFTPAGTLDAAVEHLDHLAALGIDVVELMPVAAFPGDRGWGYDGVHPYAVHQAYGGPEALQRFVDACHQRGLGVCLDVVHNHLGPSGNYLARFGPYFTDDHQTPWGPGLNLDGEGNLAVRRWMIDNALRWFRDFHVDALRLDAVHELKDESAIHVLAQLSDETHLLARALGRPLTLIAESDANDPRTIEPPSRSGLGMHAQWADDVHHALHATLTGERQGYYVDFGPLAVLAKTLTRAFWHDGGRSTFRGRDWGRPIDPDRHDGHQFVAYLQTHDQVGNRAGGERISRLLTPGQQAIGAALVMTSAFTPMVFMGEEWAASTPWQYFTDFTEPDLADAVSRGRRAEFAEHGWHQADLPDPQEAATRERSVLVWAEIPDADHARMLAWYRALISLRRKHYELADGHLPDVQVRFDQDAGWLVMTREGLRVAVNVGDRAQQVPLDGEPVDVVLCWDPATTRLDERTVELGPHGSAVVRVA